MHADDPILHNRSYNSQTPLTHFEIRAEVERSSHVRSVGEWACSAQHGHRRPHLLGLSFQKGTFSWDRTRFKAAGFPR
jgi:hypothetical protein